MGVVYRAEDLALHRKVALKLLTPELAEDDLFRERFRRESRLAASLDHSNVVPIYDAGEAGGRLFIAMRCVEGTDLKELLRDVGALPPQRTLAVFGQLADALDTAHAHGLIHRDIKPSNVLLTQQAGREQCYLSDFGLTLSASERRALTESDEIEGTAEYLAPEVIDGKPPDERSDLYALGCVLYECLSGEVPYQRDTWLATLWAHLQDPPPKPSERNPSLPAGLDDLIAKALAKDPAERYASAGELYEAAQAALLPERRSRRRWLIAAAVVLLAVVLAAVLAVVFTGGESAPATTPTLEIKTESIQHVDPETNELVATIQAPGFKVVEAGGGSLWAANADENQIWRIDPRSHRVTKTIEGIVNPELMAFGAGALWVFNPVDGIVTRIDPESGDATRAVSIPRGAPGGLLGPSGMRAGQQGLWLAWTSPAGNAVHVDPRSLAVRVVQVGPVGVSQTIDFAQIDESTLWVLAPNLEKFGAVSLLRVDPSTPGSVERDVPGFDWGLLAVDGESIWASRQFEDRVSRFETSTNELGESVSVGAFPSRVAVGANALWVANWVDGTLSRVDLDSRTVLETIAVGPNPTSLAVMDGGVWVAVAPDDA